MPIIYTAEQISLIKNNIQFQINKTNMHTFDLDILLEHLKKCNADTDTNLIQLKSYISSLKFFEHLPETGKSGYLPQISENVCKNLYKVKSNSLIANIRYQDNYNKWIKE